MWDEINFPFQNFKGFTVEVWISSFIKHFILDVITLLRFKLIYVSKRGHRTPAIGYDFEGAIFESYI